VCRPTFVDLGIDSIDPAYYTVADGEGQTPTGCETSVDVGGDQRSAAKRRPCVLHASESDRCRDPVLDLLSRARRAAAQRPCRPGGVAASRLFPDGPPLMNSCDIVVRGTVDEISPARDDRRIVRSVQIRQRRVPHTVPRRPRHLGIRRDLTRWDPLDAFGLPREPSGGPSAHRECSRSLLLELCSRANTDYPLALSKTCSVTLDSSRDYR
jgi:hypothetical protein